MDKLIQLAQAPVQENVPNDVWENAIRKYGIVAACEWFGYSSDSEFTQETIKVLAERSRYDGGV